MRNPETIEINSRLQIVKLGEQKFTAIDGYYKPQGYAFFHPDLGYLSMQPNEDCPYIPQGGKQALQRILDQGGLVSFDNCKWLQAI